MTGRKWFVSRSWRFLRWGGLAAALPALWACTTRSLEPPMLKPARDVTTTFQETVNRDIDILFLVDNSSSMKLSQNNLLRNFPVFMDVLKGLPMGLPNVHIAVVSSDMGAGTGTGGCAGNGQSGLFQWGGPMANCPATTDGARFLSNVNGNANYTGDISDVFSCVAALGETGCGFEQPLLSVTHALGADNFDKNTGKPQPPGENQGFLRDGAYLAIILITNEDDCSTPNGANSDIFPRQNDGSNLTSTLGPPTGYRCNVVGHLCGSPPAAPPIMSPNGVNDPGDLSTVVPLDNCVSNTDGRLVPTRDFAAVIKALKPDPTNQILVAAIAGLYPDRSRNAPYSVSWKRAVSGDPAGPWPEMVHSCVSTDTSFADPGIRIGEWVKEFGRNGVLQSICDSSFEPAMRRIADEIGRVLGPKCVTGVFGDKDPGTPGTQYDCVVTDHLLDAATGHTNDSTVPACAENGGAHPCWHLDADNTCRVPAGAPAGTQSLKLITDRDGMAPSGLSTTINCSLTVQI